MNRGEIMKMPKANTAPNQASDERKLNYLRQTKALPRCSISTWTKLRFISWKADISIMLLIDKLADDEFKREFPELISGLEKVPDEQSHDTGIGKPIRVITNVPKPMPIPMKPSKKVKIEVLPEMIKSEVD
jgi:hypothetical protein